MFSLAWKIQCSDRLRLGWYLCDETGCVQRLSGMSGNDDHAPNGAGAAAAKARATGHVQRMTARPQSTWETFVQVVVGTLMAMLSVIEYTHVVRCGQVAATAVRPPDGIFCARPGVCLDEQVCMPSGAAPTTTAQVPDLDASTKERCRCHWSISNECDIRAGGPTGALQPLKKKCPSAPGIA